MTSFVNDLNIMVVGATGGIGRAFVDYFAAMDTVKTIHACARSNYQPTSDKIKSHHIDYGNEDTIANAMADIAEPLDIIIVATGFLGLEPEKSLRDLSADKFNEQFLANTIGPSLVAKHACPKMRKGNKSVFACLSARVGSISDNNTMGGWYAYRASKAALNMVLKNTAIEIGRTNKDAIIMGLHPGTVDTSLSKPFQGHVPTGKLFTPTYAVSNMMDVVLNASTDQSGQLYAYDGQKIQP